MLETHLRRRDIRVAAVSAVVRIPVDTLVDSKQVGRVDLLLDRLQALVVVLTPE